jgi:hypothetical protein
LFEKGGRREGNGNGIEVESMFKLHYPHAWNYHNEILSPY